MQTKDSYGDNKKKFVLGVDVGTTNIRCYVYNQNANVMGKAQEKIHLLYPEEGKVEIDPGMLWQSFQNVVNSSISSAKLDSSMIECIGISTQRSTFLTWDRATGVPFHNFITWKDKRAVNLCDEWNRSMRMKLFRLGSKILYFMTRRRRFLAGSILQFKPAMVLMRLIWVLHNIAQVKEKCSQNQVLFGTIDTWLVWKLTGGRVHATDGSNACVTGFFDPFQMEWSTFILNMFDIPIDILPDIKDTSDIFGTTNPEIFGSSITISALVGDQQASMFGECCFQVGDVNCTLGTGTFLNINTGLSPCVSLDGVYPLVGWTINGKTTYLAECGTSDSGTIIRWAQNMGLISHPAELTGIATSVPDNGGVIFLPSFNKHQMVNDNSIATVAFVGLKPNITKAHIVRSLLEGLAFQTFSLYRMLTVERTFKMQTFRVCGGVSRNDFIVEVISNLIYQSIVRSKHFDSSSLGAAFLAGLSTGIWNSVDELLFLQKEEDHFVPDHGKMQTYKDLMLKWDQLLSSGLKFS